MCEDETTQRGGTGKVHFYTVESIHSFCERRLTCWKSASNSFHIASGHVAFGWTGCSRKAADHAHSSENIHQLLNQWDILMGFLLVCFSVFFSRFSRCFHPKQLTAFSTCKVSCKVVTSTSGAVWGSVSWPRTPQHADQGNQTSNLPLTRRWLYPWATATPIYHHWRVYRRCIFYPPGLICGDRFETSFTVQRSKTV